MVNLLGIRKTTWQILRCSLAVIQKNKSLLLFPIVIGFFTCTAALLFTAPVLLQPTGYSLNQAAHWKAVGASVYSEKTLESLSDKSRNTPVRFRPIPKFKPQEIKKCFQSIKAGPISE